MAIVPFIPESPQWLIYKGRRNEALDVLALVYADGDITAPVVLLRFKEISDTLEWEKSVGQTTSMKEVVKTKSHMRRIALVLSVAVITMLSGKVIVPRSKGRNTEILAGNNIVSYYLGTMLDNAGITDSNTQLQIVSTALLNLIWVRKLILQNVILNAFCLVSAVAGTYFADRIGRKRLAIASSIGLTVFIFMVGALTAGKEPSLVHLYFFPDANRPQFTVTVPTNQLFTQLLLRFSSSWEATVLGGLPSHRSIHQRFSITAFDPREWACINSS